MSRIKGKNTKPEVFLKSLLRKEKIKFRSQTNLPGKPDVVLPKHKIAIYVDGCFWHRCPMHFVSPRMNRDFWMKKIKGNVKRDREVNRRLKSIGWKGFRIWEHALKEKNFRKRNLTFIFRFGRK